MGQQWTIYLFIHLLGVGDVGVASSPAQRSHARGTAIRGQGSEDVGRACGAQHHGVHIILGRGHVTYVPHLLGYHAQLLKVDQAIHLGVIAQMDECQIFLHHGKERYLSEMEAFFKHLTYS